MTDLNKLRMAQIRAAEDLVIASLPPELRNPPEHLGRFGHHPDPAIDFVVEVEAIEGEIIDIAAGLPPTMNVDERIAAAVTFRVGGDLRATKAKIALRAIEASRRTAPEAAEPVAPKVSEKDINRWQDTIQQRPEGPWTLGCGGSFDRTTINPISDEMLAELAQWLRMGYTPWNGRSMPLSPGDRQFMFMLYYSVQGLIARMRAAEKLAAPTDSQAGRDAVEARRYRVIRDGTAEMAAKLFAETTVDDHSGETFACLADMLAGDELDTAIDRLSTTTGRAAE